MEVSPGWPYSSSSSARVLMIAMLQSADQFTSASARAVDSAAMRFAAWLVGAVVFMTGVSCSAQAPPAMQPEKAPAVAKFPFLDVDVKARQVRVECEALRVAAPLEFFLCSAGTN